ncbi:hypothetical protein VNO78_15502 [Psophocarpus tetragonolobus]|uniref:DUF7356 domain-containing protein n=1 Tax=Psophocarpus tetragonolobus TaxID=3891 RepID=A0AAN9XJY5_PSOTE
MRTHTLLTLFLLSLMMSDVSDAFFPRKLRDLIAPDPTNKKTKDPDPVDETKMVKKNVAISPVPEPQPLPKVENQNDDKKRNNNSPSPVSVSPPSKKNHGGDQGKKKVKQETDGMEVSHSSTNETCEGHNKCTDEGHMLACILETDSKYLIVLVHNGGDGIIKVRLRTDFENILQGVEVEKNKTEKVNITWSSSGSTQLTLNAGKADCVLHVITRTPEENFFLRLPSYDKILTPVNGAYFVIVMVLFSGATWACCACKKKRHDEIPYQELEMALPESVSATNVESAEGWDQDWDDDWDDNVAVKSPAAHAGSISANGLTSRSSNKDGWENNWDD